MVRRALPPSVDSAMLTRKGCGMVVAVLALAALAQWGWVTGRTWLVPVVAVVAAGLVVALNHAERPSRRTPSGRSRRSSGAPDDASGEPPTESP